MELIEYLSWLCIVVTVASFSAGIPPCRQILRNRSTRNIPFMPFINGAVITISNLWYGCVKEDFVLIVVNCIGSFIHVLYVLIYNLYSHQKIDIFKKTMFGVVFLLTLYMYLNMIVIEREAVIQSLGRLSLVLIMHGNISPLFGLVDVVKTKSSHGVALPFTIAMLVTSVLWLFYGFAVNDIYIMIPSISGTVSSLIQVAFVLLYPAKLTEKNK